MMIQNSFFNNKNYWIQLFFLLLFIIGGVTIFTSLGQLFSMLVYGAHPDELLLGEKAGYYRIIQSFSTIGTFAAPALLFAFCNDRKLFTYNRLDKTPPYLMVDIVLVLSIVLIPVISGIAQWNESMHFPDSLHSVEEWMKRMEIQNEEIITLLTQDNRISILIINLIVMAILPAFCEELLFRGTIQPFLSHWSKKPHLAIWITAFIFSAIHFQFFGFIPRFLLGAYLGYLLYWSGSLWLPILAHLLHNAISILIQFVMMGRGIDMENIQPTDIRGFIPVFITVSVFTIIGIIMLYKQRIDTKEY